MTGPVTLSISRATDLATAVLTAIGTPTDMAEEIAAHLVDADRVGHASHGIARLPWYCSYVEDGIVLPGARPTMATSGDAPVVSANWGFSHVGARMTTELACRRAHEARIGMAALVQSTHLGRLGAYMELAARDNCIALAFVGGMGGQRLVAPFGGRQGLLGSNPIAAGFPTRSGSPLIVDFSTASAPIGKIMVAAMAGERMPTQSLVDGDGVPTDDPAALDNGGAMRTFGDHKGFGLAILIELLGRVLLGTESFNDGAGGGQSFERQGLHVIAIAADAFRPLLDTLDDAESLRDAVHAVPPAQGFKSVLAPGDPELATRLKNEQEITVGAGAWAKIEEAARKVGVSDTLVG